MTKPTEGKTIQRRALAIEQSPGRWLYLFALAAEEILKIADVSRVSRDESGDLIGYQRPEVRRHVDEIREYLDEDDIVFPNAIILSLSSEVKFIRSRGPNVSDGLSHAGTIEIPVSTETTGKPAWIVDGQQRAFALASTEKRRLPIPIAAFIGDTVGLQRDQFIRINNTRPLPPSLVTELLPEVTTVLPARLAARRMPSALTDLLNREPVSPFYKLIRRSSTPAEERRSAVVTDTSLVKAIGESLNYPSGTLFAYRNVATEEADTDAIWTVLLWYWTAVRDTFPDAWGLPPKQSRLMHGVGIRSMGRLMDRIMSTIDPTVPTAHDDILNELAIVAPLCRWTSGTWNSIDLKWNELQNTPKHINVLSNYLVRAYLTAKRDDT